MRRARSRRSKTCFSPPAMAAGDLCRVLARLDDGTPHGLAGQSLPDLQRAAQILREILERARATGARHHFRKRTRAPARRRRLHHRHSITRAVAAHRPGLRRRSHLSSGRRHVALRCIGSGLAPTTSHQAIQSAWCWSRVRARIFCAACRSSISRPSACATKFKSLPTARWSH